MKPKKLYMEAFGSFAEAQTIDFEKLGNNLYLLAGETAAGKTTIFDAICFALYGTASGSDRKGLSALELHSDYCKHADGSKEPMEVRLDFIHGDKEYTVTRKLSWGKSKKNKSADKVSVLTGPGINVDPSQKEFDSKDNDVTQAIIKLLALDATQFSQIVMLAQGEFSNFIEAKTYEREAILARLCDNRIYQDFEVRLNALYSRLTHEITQKVDRSREALGEILEREQPQTEEEKQQYNIFNEQLLDLLQGLIDNNESAAEQNKKAQTELDERKGKLIAEKTQAANDNSLLKKLDEQQEEDQKLVGQKEMMAALEQRVAQASAALKVYPAEKRLADSNNALAKAEQEKLRIKSAITTKEQEKQELEQAEQAAKAKQKEIEALATRISILEQGLAKYAGLQSLEAAHKDKSAISDKLAKSIENLATDILAKGEAMAKCSTKLAVLKDAGQSDVDNKKLLLDGKEDKLDTAKKAKADLERTIAEEQDFLLKDGNYLVKTKAVAKLLDTYNSLHEAFLLGQAGILADELKAQLQEKEEAVCPVCHTVHHKGAEVNFATSGGKVPSKKAVDDAHKLWDTAEKEAKALYDAKQTASSKFEKSRDDVVAEFTNMFKATITWEELKATGVDKAESLCEELKKEKAAAETAWEKAKADKASREKLEQEQQLLEEAKQKLEDSKQELIEKQKTADEELSTAKTELAAYQGSMKELPATEIAAKTELKNKKADKAKLEKTIEEAEENVRKASKDLDQLSGNLITTEANISEAQQAVENSEQGLAEELQNYGFTGLEDYKKAMAPEGTLLDKSALEKYIAKGTKATSEYAKQCHASKEALVKLQEETAGLEKKDLAAIDEQIEEATKGKQSLEEQGTELQSKISAYKNNFSKLSTYTQERAKLANVLASIEGLTKSVNGNTKFRVFVLGRYFENILRFANEHLQKMTQGRYCLRHIEGTDKRQISGLDFDIFDISTNQSRSLKKLSGGEKFEVALSLALGLSDVVQCSSSRAVEINAMFIDEGFGNLGDKDINRAIDILQKLSAGNRQIGIISHVARLEEAIFYKLRVERDEKTGSHIIEAAGE